MHFDCVASLLFILYLKIFFSNRACIYIYIYIRKYTYTSVIKLIY